MNTTPTIQTRLEKKIDSLGGKLDLIQKDLIRLEVINKNHDDRSVKNAQEIELLKLQFSRADGIIQFFKIFSGIAVVNIIAFGLWVNSNIHSIKPMERDLEYVKTQIQEHEKRVQILERNP